MAASPSVYQHGHVAVHVVASGIGDHDKDGVREHEWVVCDAMAVGDACTAVAAGQEVGGEVDKPDNVAHAVAVPDEATSDHSSHEDQNDEDNIRNDPDSLVVAFPEGHTTHGDNEACALGECMVEMEQRDTDEDFSEAHRRGAVGEVIRSALDADLRDNWVNTVGPNVVEMESNRATQPWLLEVS